MYNLNENTRKRAKKKREAIMRFPDKARVCFVGDSITHNGGYIKHIVEFYNDNFPLSNVKFYNCGIAGGKLQKIIPVFDEDVMIYNPTHIVLMIGINDSNRMALTFADETERRLALLSAYEEYKKNLNRFYNITKERGIELILCTPSPYAEYQQIGIEPLKDGYELILGYADFVREFAALQAIPLCDYHEAMKELLKREVLYKPDRVHPIEKGHAIMAKTFLSFQGFEYFPKESFRHETEEWDNLSQAVRKIITTEYLAIPNYYELTDSERFSAIQKLCEELRLGIYHHSAKFVEEWILDYITEKPKQNEYIEKLKAFWKNAD